MNAKEIKNLSNGISRLRVVSGVAGLIGLGVLVGYFSMLSYWLDPPSSKDEPHS